MKKTTIKTSADGSSTRDKLLQTALRLFSKNGYNGTSTNSICETAGVNVASIAYHFGTKQNLFKELIHAEIKKGESFFDLLSTEPQTKEEFIYQARLWCEGIFVTINKNPGLHKMLVRESSLNGTALEALQAAVGKNVAIFRRFIDHAKKKKFVRPDVDADVLSFFMYTVCVDMILNFQSKIILAKYDPKDTAKRGQLLDQLMGIVFTGILSKNK